MERRELLVPIAQCKTLSRLHQRFQTIGILLDLHGSSLGVIMTCGQVRRSRKPALRSGLSTSSNSASTTPWSPCGAAPASAPDAARLIASPIRMATCERRSVACLRCWTSSPFMASLTVETACSTSLFTFGGTRPSVSTVKDAIKRSEEHTSELQSPDHLVCRLLLE